MMPARSDAQQLRCQFNADGTLYSCVNDAGASTAPVGVNAPVGSIEPVYTSVTNRADISLDLATTGSTAIDVWSSGEYPYGVGIINTGQISITSSQSVGNAYPFGIWANEVGTNGTGTTNGIQILNAGAITINLPSAQASGGAAIWAADQGGSGSSGGYPSGVRITNIAPIQVNVSGTAGFAGIQAMAVGGNGTSSPGGGGDSGPTSVSSNGGITLNWTWQNAGGSNNGVWGIQAYSRGGDGYSTNTGDTGNNGGTGGGGGNATVNLGKSGDVAVTVQGTPPGTRSSVPSAAVAAISVGGAGGNAIQGNGNSGANGGSSGNLLISATDASVTAIGDHLPGLLVYGESGAGGFGGSPATSGTQNPSQDGASGGWANGGTITVQAQSRSITISTASSGEGLSPAVAAVLIGGAGGYGGYSSDSAFSTSHGGDAGSGGSTGAINIQVQGSNGNTVTLSTAANSSPGILASNVGGAGNYGGGAFTAIGGSARAGDGGGGGWTDDVNVSLASTFITTQNHKSPGIVARSEGGLGGTGGFGNAGTGTASGGSGGNGGSTGNITVQADAASAITTQGVESMGILAQTVSGAGGNGNGNNASGGGSSGNAGLGGAAGNVTVINAGTITTNGASSRGILAQSLAGAGGAGGSSWTITHTAGGTGASGGPAGTINVTNSGAITTLTDNSEGVLMQSIGGGGGAGGQASGVLANVGGSGGVGSDGGTVNFTNSGSISTSGSGAIGVLGQSIGGGGGDGGGSSGITVTVGGSGGNAAAGGTITGDFNNGSAITTTGDGAHGAVFQSIGGGGGNGGNAISTGTFVSVAVGGTGGDGGGGGSVTVNTNGATISTAGNKAVGLVAQSIGGGGGTGGTALGTSIGAVFDASVAIGGAGGSAASMGGPVTVNMVGGSIATGQDPALLYGSSAVPAGSCPGSPNTTNGCNVAPVDTYGAVVQSIGGGGGHGGGASAQSIAVATPVTPGGSQLAISVAASVGGTGGEGGDGATAQFAMSSGATINTSGAGGTAVLVQSIGGGGGTGGDSSASAATMGYGSQSVPDDGVATGVDMTATVGGNGGGPGAGGPVQVAIGGTIYGGTMSCDCSPNLAPTSIVTYGDFADGVKAQSIGGGGGDAGLGGGNTQHFGSGNSGTLSFNVGRNGSKGGDGGAVTVNLYPGNGIKTWGSGAVGIIAQSIGGGGGTSQGGSFSVGAAYQPPGAPGSRGIGSNVNLGNHNSEAGGNGQAVTVSVQANITTNGGDATGVLAQSIGGGGGLGGSSGSDASGDNPVIAALQGREFESDIVNYINDQSEPQFNATSNISIGGQGGGGGVGGTVSVSLASLISTAGDWAHGIVAQSIGGGGGKGGAAMASGTGADPAEFNTFYNMAVGGQGGNGGAGGAVQVTLASTSGGGGVSTAGYAASAIVAQSVGGGGGMAGEGSDTAGGNMSLGGATNKDSGSAGEGGSVTLTTNNSALMTVSTTGMAADGIALQSVGGGGGMVGAGSTKWVETGSPPAHPLVLVAGGGAKVDNADGGDVAFNPDGAVTPLLISTAGYNSFGILAQSVGGGGGVITSTRSVGTQSTLLGGLGGGNGGNVSVTLGAGQVVQTTGIGAYGIVAQSVGSGGGIIRVPGFSTDVPILQVGDDSNTPATKPGSGDGGSVTVVSNGTVATSGAGAIGIFAQSVGGGGGLITNGVGEFAGAMMSNQYNCSSVCGGVGGPVSVTVNGDVTASGQAGIGVFAQVSGYGPRNTAQVTVNGTVTGGYGVGAAGVMINNPPNSETAQAIVGSSGSVTSMDGINGTAFLATGGAALNIDSYGFITGLLDTNRGALRNYASATYTPGATVKSDIINSGLVNLTDPGMTTTVSGDYTQSAGGRLGVAVDSLNKRASFLQVNGTGALDGNIVPNAVTLLPGTLAVFNSTNLTSTVDAQDSLLFRWDASRSGNTISITPNATLTPDGVSLNGSQSSLANYYTRAWNNVDATFATTFAGLSRVNDGGTYKRTLDNLSSKATQAQSMAVIESAGTILGAGMSCPVFVGDGVQLGENNCVWGQVNGRWTDQQTTSDVQGYHVSGTTYRIGAQHEIAPNWYLGGSVAAGQTWARSKGGSSGDGDVYDGSITLKRVMGPWYFAGSLAVATGSFNNNRQVNALGDSVSLGSDSSIFLTGARFRAGYEFNRGDWYIKPYGDMDVLYTHAPGFKESGASPYALDVRTSDQTNVAFTPMIEFGRRADLDAKTTLRAYAAFGLSWRPDNTRTVRSSFVGADTANGTFTDYIESPEVLAKVDLGLQLFRSERFELRAGYTADIGHSFVSQSATARFAYHF